MSIMISSRAIFVYKFLTLFVNGQNYYRPEERPSPAMWNILLKKPLSLNPPGSVCDNQSDSTALCVPDVYGRRQAPRNYCLPRSCLAQNSNISVISDDNLATVFVTQNLSSSLEVTADLVGSYTVYYIRTAFSGNPPTSIVIQNQNEGDSLGSQEWSTWRIFASDCLGTFGLNPVLRPQISNREDLICSPLPWSNQTLSVVSSLVWNVLLDYSNASVVDSVDHGVTSLRFIFAGHLLPFPQSGNSKSDDVYGIADIGVYGRCAVGSYRSSNSSTCNGCRCDVLGSVNQTCSAQGNCLCKSNFRGSKCSTCSSGFFNASAGCLSCRCNELGSKEGLCNSENGSCLCRAGFEGPTCTECVVGLFLLSHRCAPCNCNPAGSLPGCGPTGACRCKRFVTGVRCDVCLDGFVDLQLERPEGCTQRTTATTNSPIVGNSTMLLLLNEMSNSPENQSAVLIEARQVTTSFLMDNGSIVEEVPLSAVTTLSTTITPLSPFVVGSLTKNRSAESDSYLYLGSPAVYDWLVAITVLLILTLLILLLHCLLYLRRRKSQGRYSPPQIPEFLATETTRKHPDYADVRPNPITHSAKLTGYFYNPDYALGALTPGLHGRRDTGTARESQNSRHGMEFAVNDEEPIDRGLFQERKRPLDLTQEPAPSGTLPSRLSHYHAPVTNRPVQTISGGVVNENYVD